MKNFNKIILVIALGMSSITNIHASKLHEVQILVDTAAPWFFYFMNIGSIMTNFFCPPRMAGAYYIANGLIYPGDTIDVKNQSSFLVDRHGTPLTPANSIGTFYDISFILTNYSVLTPLTAGTPLTVSNYTLAFNTNPSPSDATTLFGSGVVDSSGHLQARRPLFYGVFAETGGTEHGLDAEHHFKMKYIPAPSMTAFVIELKFDHPIKIYD
jgi:hypothetical protein